MFKDEWTLLVCVTLQTAGVSACCESRLFEFETAVRIVTITALDQSLKHLVMERPAELGFRFAVTANA